MKWSMNFSLYNKSLMSTVKKVFLNPVALQQLIPLFTVITQKNKAFDHHPLTWLLLVALSHAESHQRFFFVFFKLT